MSSTASAPIYLDHNATTPLWPEVREAMFTAWTRYSANPASQHRAGRQVRRALEDAREEIGLLLGAAVNQVRPDRILFTSGGTESNNLALWGLGDPAISRIIISSIEHPSILEAAEAGEKRGWQVDQVQVSPDGVIDLEHLEALLQEPARLVSLMMANNETGVVQPIQAAAAICQEYGVPLHTDATQAGGKKSLHFREMGVAAMTLSAHKFHGPMGISALLIRNDIPMQPFLFGGFQQEGLRPGTESIAPVLGMLKALQLWEDRRVALNAHWTELRDNFESRIISTYRPAHVHGFAAPRMPHTSNISFPGCDRQALLIALDLQGIACSTGSACASGSSEPSKTLIAMGCPGDHLQSALRFSLGAGTTSREMDRAAEIILNCVHSMV
ncbi:Cysteine desulfurase NifS [Planctomycetales bacterium 10988]|nr:Cysteine desulfurase NifS [Planctomycetales bacterium 10988]